MDDGEVALYSDRDRDEDGADPADVPEPETHRENEDVNGPGIPIVQETFRIFWGASRFEPGAAGREAQTLPQGLVIPINFIIASLRLIHLIN